MPTVLITQILFVALGATTGLVFNGYILSILVWQKRLQTVNHILLLHLACVDILFSTLLLFGNTSLGLFGPGPAELIINSTSSSLSSSSSSSSTPSSLTGTSSVIPEPLDFNQSTTATTRTSTTFLLPPLLTTSTALKLVNQCQGFLWTLFPIILIWTVSGLCCDRYLAVTSPLRYLTLVTRKRAALFILTVWSIGIGLCIPPLFGICNYEYSFPRFSNSLTCVTNVFGRYSTSSSSSDILVDDHLTTTTTTTTSNQEIANLVYVLIYIFASLLLPIFCILGCNLHMLLIARHHHHRIVSAIYEITLRAQATVTHQKNPHYLSKVNGRYAVFTISQFITIAFTLPFYTIFLLESLIPDLQLSPLLVSIMTLLLSFTPTINGYVYGVKSKVLKQTFKRLLQRYLYKKQASLEIDRRLSLRSQSSIRTFNGLQTFLSTTSLIQTNLTNGGGGGGNYGTALMTTTGNNSSSFNPFCSNGCSSFRRNSAPIIFSLPSMSTPSSSPKASSYLKRHNNNNNHTNNNEYHQKNHNNIGINNNYNSSSNSCKAMLTKSGRRQSMAGVDEIRHHLVCKDNNGTSVCSSSCDSSSSISSNNINSHSSVRQCKHNRSAHFVIGPVRALKLGFEGSPVIVGNPNQIGSNSGSKLSPIHEAS